MSAFDYTGSGHLPVGGKTVFHLDEHTCHHTNGSVCPMCAELTDEEVAALREYITLLKRRAENPALGEENSQP